VQSGGGPLSEVAVTAVDAIALLDEAPGAQIDWNQMIGPGLKLFPLPLDVILKNNCALGYFIDYVTSIGCQVRIIECVLRTRFNSNDEMTLFISVGVHILLLEH
jgi:hypothetical protein